MCPLTDRDDATVVAALAERAPTAEVIEQRLGAHVLPQWLDDVIDFVDLLRPSHRVGFMLLIELSTGMPFPFAR